MLNFHMYSCVPTAVVYFILIILSECFQSPEITGSPSDTVIVLPGASIQLTCTALGSPTPVLYWIRLDSTLSNAANYINPGELVIPNFSTTDNGIYVCAAINDYGMDVSNITTVTTDGRAALSLANY